MNLNDKFKFLCMFIIPLKSVLGDFQSKKCIEIKLWKIWKCKDKEANRPRKKFLSRRFTNDRLTRLVVS